MDTVEELNNIEDLELRLGEVSIPWDEIAPPAIGNWLNVIAKSHGTSRDLLLVSILPTTSALIGNSSIKLFDSWKERGNLFFVGLAPSGCGKTPACNIGCVYPLINHLEPKLNKSILVDETSTSGLFNHFVANKANAGHVPVLCVDEAYTFMGKLISNSKATSTNLSMERLCKLYDGDYWYAVKGAQGKRVGTQSARLSMCTFTTPRRFLDEIWPKVIASKNGLPDRMLLVYKCREEISIEDIEQFSETLKESTVKGLGTVFEHIHTEHCQEEDIEYSFSPLAKESFLKYIKAKESVQASQGACAFEPECNAKIAKNTLRLALSMHVLWHRLGKALDQLTGPTPRVIPECTLNMALILHDCLLTFNGIAETCLVLKKGSGTIRVGVSDSDIKERILSVPGPFCSRKRAYNSFSSSQRPSPKATDKCMDELAADNLGKCVKVNKSYVFFKALPPALLMAENKLAPFNLNHRRYEDIFGQQDALVPQTQQENIIACHPEKDDFVAYRRAEQQDDQ